MSQDRGDAAAIMLGTAVIGYAVFSRAGLYEEFDFGVALAIFFVLIAYIWPNRRTLLQSIALAMILGGCLIPIVGYLVVLLFHPANEWAGGVWDNVIGTICWLVGGISALFIDRNQNNKRPA